MKKSYRVAFVFLVLSVFITGAYVAHAAEIKSQSKEQISRLVG